MFLVSTLYSHGALSVTDVYNDEVLCAELLIIRSLRLMLSLFLFILEMFKMSAVSPQTRLITPDNGKAYIFKKSKAIPVTGRGGPYDHKTMRFPHFLHSRFTDGAEVSLTRRPPFTPQEDSWYSFLLEAESTPRP
jgi:hypothetical protein